MVMHGWEAYRYNRLPAQCYICNDSWVALLSCHLCIPLHSSYTLYTVSPFIWFCPTQSHLADSIPGATPGVLHLHGNSRHWADSCEKVSHLPCYTVFYLNWQLKDTTALFPAILSASPSTCQAPALAFLLTCAVDTFLDVWAAGNGSLSDPRRLKPSPNHMPKGLLLANACKHTSLR